MVRLLCLNTSGCMWWCRGVGDISWHTLGLLVPSEHHLNTTASLNTVAGHLHPFMTTVYPSSDDCFQYKAPYHEAQIKLVSGICLHSHQRSSS